MKHYALIGRTLVHSYSKKLFDAQHFADADYSLCPMPTLERLRQWVDENHISGFNVTNPYKVDIIPQLDSISPEAEAIGAVNCVVVDHGRLIGHNTDAPAFQQTLLDKLNTEHLTPDTAYILGTGGAARAVAYAIGQLGIRHTFVSRHPELHTDLGKDNVIGYSHLSPFTFHLSPLIINATPVGTYPDIDATPLPLASELEHSSINTFIFYDLIYNPSPTRLLREAAAAGAIIIDGSAMLRLQARLSWQLWGLKQ